MTLRALKCALGLGMVPALLGMGCPWKSSATGTDGAVSSTAASASFSEPHRMGLAEDTRAPDKVQDEDLGNGEVAIRRAAARALARMENPLTADRLLASLADGDPEVIAWAAYGLGQICSSDRDRFSRRLVARAMTLRDEPIPSARLSPWFAMARALGRCSGTHAERTLVAWLDGDPKRREASALALGDVATRNRRMAEESAAALLRAAIGDAAHEPLPGAFYPFGRLRRAPARATERLLESCRTRLGHPHADRIYLLRALGTLDEDVAPDLGTVLTQRGFTPEERAEAARALGKLPGSRGVSVLIKALDKLKPGKSPSELDALVGPDFGPLLASLRAIPRSPKRRADPPLRTIAALPIPPEAPAHLRRRINLLRCGAARVLVGSAFDDPALVKCQEKGSTSVGALARIDVLDQTKLRGAALQAWRAYLDPKKPPVVREAALRLISSHQEIPDAPKLLAKALHAKEPGVVATAAQTIARHPDRVFLDAPKKPSKGKPAVQSRPDGAVVKALTAAWGREFPPDAVETRGQIARAAGALRLDAARPWLKSLCESPNPTMRNHAQSALRSLDGNKKTACDFSGAKRYAPSDELGRLVDRDTTLTLDTDVGTLKIVLRPALAPVAVTRMVALARAGFFNKVGIHRVEPGFVVQFGDPGGDGYGGAGKPSLRCETSPVPFAAGTVGVALGGRDTGSSQMFVTLTPTPHLDGQYAVIGEAEGPWNVVAEGDVIQRVSVAP